VREGEPAYYITPLWEYILAYHVYVGVDRAVYLGKRKVPGCNSSEMSHFGEFYMMKCREVAASDVPPEWRTLLGRIDYRYKWWHW
jgi:hypothetical protein